jgi:ubiquinone/menaquinone biosynthesis C-methylase UbiE
VQQYLHPARLVALDFSREGLVRCARQHAGRPIHFVCGDALHLPFPDGSFDAVINVEASHCYPDLAKFLSQVRRVLRPGGHLLYADLRRERQYGPWREEILRSGLTLLEEENLTPHVARALDASNERTTALVREVAPRLLRRAMMRFAGTRSSEVYRGLRSGSIRYARFVLRK